MKLLVTLQYEYDVNPEHYPQGHTPTEMALLDVESEPMVISEGKNLVVTAEEVKS